MYSLNSYSSYLTMQLWSGGKEIENVFPFPQMSTSMKDRCTWSMLSVQGIGKCMLVPRAHKNGWLQ